MPPVNLFLPGERLIDGTLLNNIFLGKVPITGLYATGEVRAQTISAGTVSFSAVVASSAAISGTTQTSLLVVGSAAAIANLSVGGHVINTIRQVTLTLDGAPLANSQISQVACTQAGTLLSAGAVASPVTAPGSTMTAVLAHYNGGTVAESATISVATNGTVTLPAFTSMAIAAGDSLRLTGQASADGSGGNLSVSWPFVAT